MSGTARDGGGTSGKNGDGGKTVSLPVLVRTMAAMASADGRVAEGEVEGIAALLRELTGEDVDHDDVRGIIETQSVDAPGFLDELRALGPTLDETGREIIVVAGLMVATADGEMQDTESGLIGEMAAALGLTDADVKRLVVELLED